MNKLLNDQIPNLFVKRFRSAKWLSTHSCNDFDSLHDTWKIKLYDVFDLLSQTRLTHKDVIEDVTSLTMSISRHHWPTWLTNYKTISHLVLFTKSVTIGVLPGFWFSFKIITKIIIFWNLKSIQIINHNSETSEIKNKTLWYVQTDRERKSRKLR